MDDITTQGWVNGMTRKEKRRQKILQAAEELFQHYGTHKTTVADIARQAQIGVGSVYLAFSSKDDIIKALSEERHNDVLAAMSQAASEQNLSYSQRLCMMLKARVQTFLEHANKGHHAPELIKGGKQSCCMAIEDAYATFCLHQHQMLTTLLTEGQASGEFDFDDITQTVNLIEQMMLALSPPAIFQHPPETLPAFIEQFSHLLLHGLLRR